MKKSISNYLMQAVPIAMFICIMLVACSPISSSSDARAASLANANSGIIELTNPIGKIVVSEMSAENLTVKYEPSQEVTVNLVKLFLTSGNSNELVLAEQNMTQSRNTWQYSFSHPTYTKNARLSIMVVVVTAEGESYLPQGTLGDSSTWTSIEYGVPDLVIPEIQGWELFWHDEFNDGVFDTTKWTREEMAAGTVNNEWQKYSTSPDYSWEENGNMVLRLSLDENKEIGPGNYTSARINSAGKFDFTYGKIQSRIRIDYMDQGVWPAFWMLGSSIDEYGGNVLWPECGEIDILEVIGGTDSRGTYDRNREHEAWATLHWSTDPGPTANNQHTGRKYENGMLVLDEPIWGITDNDYHIFECTWDKDFISISLDGNIYFTASVTDFDQSEFDNPFFLLYNIACGGDWPGAPTLDKDVHMYVDWVRVYKEDESNPPSRIYTGLRNGTFDNSAEFWQPIGYNRYYGYPAGWDMPRANYEIVNGEYICNVFLPDEAWNPKIRQIGLTLFRGQEYTLMFDACSIGDNREIKVQCGPSEPFIDEEDVVWELDKSITLSTSTETYGYRFTPSKTIYNGGLFFLVGEGENEIGNSTGIILDNVSLQETNYNNPITLMNGTFDNSMDNWTLYTHYNATGWPRREVKVDINRPGPEEGVVLEMGSYGTARNATYTVSFEARSTIDRPIKVEVYNKSDPDDIVWSKYINLNEDMKQFGSIEDSEFQFTMDKNAGLIVKFIMGNVTYTSDSGVLFKTPTFAPHDVYIDSISLKQTNPNSVPYEVKPYGTYPFSYIGSQNLITRMWGSASISQTFTEAKIEIDKTGPKREGIIFYQGEFILEQGELYTIQFDARSTLDREIEFSIEDETDNYHQIFSEIVSLNNKMNHYSFSFIMSETNMVTLKFILGAINEISLGEHDIFLDNVILSKM